jgi:hypothetical protein
MSTESEHGKFKIDYREYSERSRKAREPFPEAVEKKPVPSSTPSVLPPQDGAGSKRPKGN